MGKTLRKLIDEAKTIVSTERSDLNQAKTLSRIHNRLFVRLGKDSSQYSVYEDVTVANQLVYELPTNCRINNIVNMTIQVETYEDSGVYEDYEYKSLDESIDFDNCFIRGDANDEYKLYENVYLNAKAVDWSADKKRLCIVGSGKNSFGRVFLVDSGTNAG